MRVQTTNEDYISFFNDDIQRVKELEGSVLALADVLYTFSNTLIQNDNTSQLYDSKNQQNACAVVVATLVQAYQQTRTIIDATSGRKIDAKKTQGQSRIRHYCTHQ